MLGFAPLSATPLSGYLWFLEPLVEPVPVPVVPAYTGGGGGAARTEEHGRERKQREEQVRKAWEDIYEPKPTKAPADEETAEEDAVAETEVAYADPKIISLLPFLFPEVVITEEELQQVVQLAVEARKRAWEQRITILRQRLAQANQENSNLFPDLLPPRLQ